MHLVHLCKAVQEAPAFPLSCARAPELTKVSPTQSFVPPPARPTRPFRRPLSKKQSIKPSWVGGWLGRSP